MNEAPVRPSTYRLLAAVLLNGVGLNLVLAYVFNFTTTLRYAGAFLSVQAKLSDSWGLMRQALHYMDKGHDKPIYTGFFFDQHAKFQYPPSSLLPFELLRKIPGADLISNRSLDLISWVFMAGALALVALLFDRASRKVGEASAERPIERWLRVALAVGASITFYPLIRSFGIGQIQTWIDCLCAGVLFAYVRDRKDVAGVLTALICVIKPQLGLLVLWAALRKEWRFVIGWAATFSVVMLAALAVYGLENHLDYLAAISFMSKHGESFNHNQSINGLLHRFLFNGNNLVWVARDFPPYNRVVHIGTSVTTAIFVGMALFYRRGEYARASVTDLSIAMLSFTIASPIAWEHHYGVLPPILALAVPATMAAGKKLPLGNATLVAVLLLCSNFYQFTDRFATSRLNVVQSYLFFGGLILLVHLYRLRRLEQGDALAAPAAEGKPEASAAADEAAPAV
jgi:hypothetical protein